jgi:hypothetical protein
MEGKDRKPFDIAGALRTQYPALVLAALCLWAYVDLKGDVREVRDEASKEARSIAEGLPGPDQEKAAKQPGEPPMPPPPPPMPPPERAAPSWDCDGLIPHEKVLETVGKQGQAVFDCYKKALEQLPDLKGTLILELNVGKAGEVREARVRGPLKEPGLLECVSASIYTWSFVAPEGGECAIVSVPFLLDPADHGPGASEE